MRPHRRRIQEQPAGFGKGLGVENFPQARPDAARLPTPEAHVNGVPVAERGRQIAPRTARAIEIKQRFEKLAIARSGRSTGPRMLGLGEGFLQLVPPSIIDHFSDW